MRYRRDLSSIGLRQRISETGFAVADKGGEAALEASTLSTKLGRLNSAAKMNIETATERIVRTARRRLRPRFRTMS